jgi:lysyl-tRNA synthetase, class I
VAPADDWVARTAGQVRAEGERRHPGEAPTCASGISPSGPVHLGNLRELMVPHLVADEVRKQGAPCRHILSWDDYDRLRRVPAGFPPEFSEHVGRPLSAVPDPCGRHPNWAEHFKEPLRESLARLGVLVTEISQTQMYTSGAYIAQIVTAMRRRADIRAVLAKYQTKRTEPDEDDDLRPASAQAYYPFKPYCAVCGRDDTTVTGFDDETTEITYTCACGAHVGPVPIAEVAGKLVWKVDWPMRWAYEHVTFEPAGVDHSSPGSSFTVGGELVSEIFGGEMPLHFGYAFVGTSGGSSKMSGSAGGAPTPTDALEIFEAPILRWLYARRRPEQSITLAFGDEVGRVYDEWDTLSRKVADGTADAPSRTVFGRASGTAEGPLPVTPRPLPFRTLASLIDITAGDETQILRILRDLTVPEPVAALDEVRPRLDCAEAWVANYLDPADRTRIRTGPDAARLAALSEEERGSVKLLTERMGENWSLDGLTTLLYGIPKLQRGLPISAPPTPELKAAQRTWFILLYQLLIGENTGPRLPTLLLALGQDRIRSLLTALYRRTQQRGPAAEARPGPRVPCLLAGLLRGLRPRVRLRPGLFLRLFQPVGRPLHQAQRHGQAGRGLCPQRGVGRLAEQAAVGDGVQDGGYPGADLARRAHAPLVPGRRRQGGRVVAGPVPGQQRVQHPGQRGGVRCHRIGGPRFGAAEQRRVQAQAGDLEARAGVPAQRVRGQPQVRPPGPVRHGERVRRVGDHGGGQRRVRQPGAHQVFQVRAPGPLGHDVRTPGREIGVVDGGQARIAYPGGGPHRVHHVRRDRSPAGQQVDGDRAAEQFVGGLPHRKPRRRDPRPGPARRADPLVEGDALVEPEAAAQPGSGYVLARPCPGYLNCLGYGHR